MREDLTTLPGESWSSHLAQGHFCWDTTLLQLRQRVCEICLCFLFAPLCLLSLILFSILTFCPVRLDTGLEPLDLEAISFSDSVSGGTPAAELPDVDSTYKVATDSIAALLQPNKRSDA